MMQKARKQDMLQWILAGGKEGGRGGGGREWKGEGGEGGGRGRGREGKGEGGEGGGGRGGRGREGKGEGGEGGGRGRGREGKGEGGEGWNIPSICVTFIFLSKDSLPTCTLW